MRTWGPERPPCGGSLASDARMTLFCRPRGCDTDFSLADVSSSGFGVGGADVAGDDPDMAAQAAFAAAAASELSASEENTYLLIL
jgi:hypothetical protein